MRGVVALFLTFVTLALISPVFAYELYVKPTYRYCDEDLVNLTQVYGEFRAINNRDMNITIEAQIDVSRRLLNCSAQSFDLCFNPWEFIHTPPASNIRYSIYNRYQNISGVLNKNGEIKKIHKIYCIQVNVTPEIFENSYQSHYNVNLNYLLKNYIFKQGDYYVIIVNFPNMEKNMNGRDDLLFTLLCLSDSNSIPYRFPEDVKGQPYYEYKSGKEIERWCFYFSGSKERVFWYFDVKEMRYKNLAWIIFGASISAIIGMLSGISDSKKKIIILLLLVIIGYCYWYISH